MLPRGRDDIGLQFTPDRLQDVLRLHMDQDVVPFLHMDYGHPLPGDLNQRIGSPRVSKGHGPASPIENEEAGAPRSQRYDHGRVLELSFRLHRGRQGRKAVAFRTFVRKELG